MRAGILEQRDTGRRISKQAIDRDPTLTDRQKQALLEVYRSFQREAADPAGPVDGAQTPESAR